MSDKATNEAYWYAFLDALEREREATPALDVIEWAKQYKQGHPQEG